jgi:hypothetical protein
MRCLQRLPSSPHIVVSTLACAALTSGLTAQQPRDRLPSAPAVQCYAISPDTGSRPWFLPEHLVLGANPTGGDLRAAAVLPNRVRSTSRQDGEDTLFARWTSYGRLHVDDSIYVEVWILGSLYGPIGMVYAHADGDSLSGRAAERSDQMPTVVAWLPIHGRTESCPSRL